MEGLNTPLRVGYMHIHIMFSLIICPCLLPGLSCEVWLQKCLVLTPERLLILTFLSCLVVSIFMFLPQIQLQSKSTDKKIHFMKKQTQERRQRLEGPIRGYSSYYIHAYTHLSKMPGAENYTIQIYKFPMCSTKQAGFKFKTDKTDKIIHFVARLAQKAH